MSEGEHIRCRVRGETCEHGRPSIEVYDSGTIAGDGTFDGETVVCDACYTALGCPTEPSGDPALLAGGKGRRRR